MLQTETVNKMRDSLVIYRYMALGSDDDCKSAKFHHEWSDLLLKDKTHVVMEAFRQSAKSSYVLRAYPLHCFSFPHKDRDFIVIIKNNATQAKAKLKEIADELKGNPLVSHNLVKIQEDNSQTLSVDVKNECGEIVNVRIEAYGKGASIRGLSNKDRRPKVLILDDIQDLEDARSETVTESDWNWFLSDIVFLGKDSRIFYIANNLGDKCIAERLMEAEFEGLQFKKIRIPQLDGENPTWPERGDTLAAVLRERDDYSRIGKLDIWYQEKMCIAVADENKTFQEADYRYYEWHNKEMLIKTCSLFAGLDPASSTHQESCYRAIGVVGADDKSYRYLFSMKYGRWDSNELINQIFNTVTEFNLRDFYIEKGQIQQILEPILIKEMRIRNIFFNIQPLEHAKIGSKVERINALQPLFKSHSYLFPTESKASWVAEVKAEMSGVTRTEIKSKYIDCVDVMASLEQVVKPPHRRMTNMQPKRYTAKVRI